MKLQKSSSGRCGDVFAFVALAVMVPVSGWCEDLVDFRAPVLVPAPVEMSYDSNVPVRLDASVVFEMSCPDPAATWVRGKADKWFGIKNAMVKVVDGEVPARMSDEGYSLKAEPGRIAIGAKTLQDEIIARTVAAVQ